MNKGYLCLVLHTHLPYVRHPEFEDFLEEDWLYEAITETYIPLINMMERLVADNVDFRLTFSLTPTLITMLEDPLLQERYLKHINKLIELSHHEIERTSWQHDFQGLAVMYLNSFCKARDTFEKYNRNLVTAFKNMQDMGKIEIITCGATHGFFPLMDVCKESVRAQLKVAVSHYETALGRKPQGIWLPECGYQPGHDELLKESGIRFFFTDSHGVLHGSPRPKYGVFAPVYCRGTGVACFARDLESSKQVWSSIEGYPGDYCYREFYRDIGFDLDFEYIKPYIHPDGIRINTGIKYYRITGSEEKKPYDPDLARETAASHAGNFLFNREKQVEYLHDFMGKKPIIVSPYDAELFGHWWYEGPMWLEFLIRKIHFDQKTIKMITPSEYLHENPRNQVITPSLSSWGYKGYAEMWMQGTNDWVYRHLHKGSERMTELAKTFSHNHIDDVKRRALNQALRELLLAQSSDWAFILGSGTHTDYAVRRTKEHLLRFTRLYDEIKANTVDESWLSEIEYKDKIFPNIDYRVHQ
jgi:1,4-alpha-glucan branching enzyme